MSKHSTGDRGLAKSAGIDVGKHKLDVAVHGSEEQLTVPNDADGHHRLAEHLRAHAVERVGLEASGPYHASLAQFLRQAGFAVAVFEPAQLKGYRRYMRKLAKTDTIDAALIATATAELQEIRTAGDPRLVAFAEQLTWIEQINQDIARHKTRRDRYTDAAIKRDLEAEIVRLERRLAQARLSLRKKVQAHADLKQRYALLLSIPGIGAVTALSLVVRMPELGSMSRGQASALLGAAPVCNDSGARAGVRHIAGGRARVRKVMYMAALSASTQWNEDLKAHYQHLIDKGKHKKVAFVACMRKLITTANAVLARGTPWLATAPSPKAA